MSLYGIRKGESYKPYGDPINPSLGAILIVDVESFSEVELVLVRDNLGEYKMDAFKIYKDYEKVNVCMCGKEGEPPHPCPYAEEIGGNDDPEYCTCCGECEHECCMDI